MPLPWRRARKEATGPARPGRQRRGGRRPEAGWAGAARDGVAAEPPLPERSLWPAADVGAAGSAGLLPAFARPSATTGGQFPAASASLLAVAAAAARSRRRHRRRAQSPPTRTLGAPPPPPPPNLPPLIGCPGAYREMQSRARGAGRARRKRRERAGGGARARSRSGSGPRESRAEVRPRAGTAGAQEGETERERETRPRAEPKQNGGGAAGARAVWEGTPCSRVSHAAAPHTPAKHRAGRRGGALPGSPPAFDEPADGRPVPPAGRAEGADVGGSAARQLSEGSCSCHPGLRVGTMAATSFRILGGKCLSATRVSAGGSRRQAWGLGGAGGPSASGRRRPPPSQAPASC